MRYSDRYFSVSESESGPDGVRRAAKGVAVTLSSQSVKFMLQFGSIMLLARLLTPEDFGLIAMVSVFVNFLSMFKDFGLSQAVIQSQELKRDQVSSLFWINIGICFCISLSVLVIAPVVAKFYGREELVAVTMLLGGGIAFQSVGLQHRALLIRTMQFVKVEVVEVLAMLAALCVAICLAIYGYAYWALVWQVVSQSLVLSLGYILACGWLPGRFGSIRECLPLLRFGGGMFSCSLVNYFSRNVDNVLVGKFLGASALGLYNKAHQLLRLPMSQVTGPISKVVFPTLSRIQSVPKEFRRRYLQFLRLITVINVPIVIYFTVFADIVVEVLLGEQWLEMVPVFRCLAPAALMAATNVATGWVLVPLGRVSRQFYIGLGSSVVNLVAIVIGLNWGMLGVALAVSFSRTIMKLPTLYLAYSKTPISGTDFIRIQFWPFMASVFAGCLAHLSMNVFSLSDDILFLSVSLILYFSAYVVVLLLGSETRSELALLKNHIIKLKSVT